jgi:hypothetical protein
LREASPDFCFLPQPTHPQESVVVEVATIVAHPRQTRLHLRKFHQTSLNLRLTKLIPNLQEEEGMYITVEEECANDAAVV